MKPSSKLVAAAVATVLGTSAHALAPTAPITYTFYEGGGAADENAVYSALYNLLSPSTVDVYSDAGAKASSSYLVVTGTTVAGAGGNTQAPFNTATNILFIYKFNKGALTNGILPLAYATSASQAKLAYPTVASIASATPSGNSGTPTTSNPSYSYTAANTNSESTDFGLSDVETGLFNYAYNLNNTPALTASQLSAIAGEGVYDDVLALAVTNTVYNGAHPKTSFTKPEIVGILTGTTTNWNQMYADDGTIMPNAPLWFLDRGSGAAVKAVGNQFFLNYPGGANYTGASLTPHSVLGSNANGGYTDTVLNLSGAYQDVNEASSSAIVTDLQNAQAAGDYAIGFVSAETAPALNQVGGVNVYSFAKIDGVGIDSGTAGNNINGTTASTYNNVVTGAYEYVSQVSFNYRAGFLIASSPGSITLPPAGSAPNVVLTYATRNNLQSVTLAGANSGKSFPLSVTGVLIDPVLAPSQVAGVILDSRNHVTAAPLQPSFDATDVSSSGGPGPITYGSDPL